MKPPGAPEVPMDARKRKDLIAAGGAAGFVDADLRPVVDEEVEGVDAHVLQDQVLVACLVAVLGNMADVLVPLVPAPLQARREHHRLGHFGGIRVAVRPRCGHRGRRRGIEEEGEEGEEEGARAAAASSFAASRSNPNCTSSKIATPSLHWPQSSAWSTP